MRMTALSKIWRRMFDIRHGEHVQTWAMFAYLFAVLMAYYILKPVSRSMFLTKFDVDKLPSLYIVIAIAGGVFAYFYSKVAARTSLRTAVLWTMLLSIISLIVMWELIAAPGMIYVLNIWVSLFSIVLVSQGWLVAGNIFNARQAKRLYPLLGMSMVLGAACGGEFTNRVVRLVGTRNLLLACAVIVVIAYVAFRIAVFFAAGFQEQAHAGSEAPSDFSFRSIVGDLTRVRHLQVIVGLMIAMYVVDTLVEYQLQFVAGHAYQGDRLTAFFGQFYGLYLNGIEAIFQLFLTAAVIRRFGVGYTLQIAPVTVGLSSLATVLAPGVVSGSLVRLTEASTRYTLNRTGMELLYMPLPRELRNRVKAFIDVAVDRLSRGLGGVLLLALTGSTLHLGIRGISVVVIVVCGVWAFFSMMARNEYVTSVRRRLDTRSVDLHLERITVSDSDTIRLLEETAMGTNARHAAYALTMLAEAPGYDLQPLLLQLKHTPAREVEEKVYELAAGLKFDGLLETAMAKIRAACSARLQPGYTLPHGVADYAVSVSRHRTLLATALLHSNSAEVVSGTLDGLRADPKHAKKLITQDWLTENAFSDDPHRRALAAKAIGVREGEDAELLHRLLMDPETEPAISAAHTAGLLRSRGYVEHLVDLLGRTDTRAAAISSLAAYGSAVTGTLGDILNDETISLRIRRQIPRVLKNIPLQRSVDVLMGAVNHNDLVLRSGVLKALNVLRETSNQLRFDSAALTAQFMSEAHYYFELNASLESLRVLSATRRSATDLLVRTVEARLRDTLERLFRLLGLRYPPKEIYTTYRAVLRPGSEEATAAVEFLDSTLEPDLKRILLPLLDAPEYALDRGRELFGIEPPPFEEAIRTLMSSGDEWLRACADAAAAESVAALYERPGANTPFRKEEYVEPERRGEGHSA
jgi:ATP:ADP antiporter, AAA family